jgi:hypothetical protein
MSRLMSLLYLGTSERPAGVVLQAGGAWVAAIHATEIYTVPRAKPPSPRCRLPFTQARKLPASKACLSEIAGPGLFFFIP